MSLATHERASEYKKRLNKNDCDDMRRRVEMPPPWRQETESMREEAKHSLLPEMPAKRHSASSFPYHDDNISR